MRPNELVVSLVKSTGDVGVVYDLLKARIVNNVNWSLLFEITFPEYYKALIEDKSMMAGFRSFTSTINEPWKSLTLWMTYYHRRVIKYLSFKSKTFSKDVEPVRTLSEGIRIDSVVYKGNKIDRTTLAKKLGSQEGFLIDFSIDDPIINANSKSNDKALSTAYSPLLSSSYGRVDRYTIVLKQLTHFFCKDSNLDLDVLRKSLKANPFPFLITSSTESYVPKGKRKIFLGNTCIMCNATSTSKCSRCGEIFCGDDCFKNESHVC